MNIKIAILFIFIIGALVSSTSFNTVSVPQKEVTEVTRPSISSNFTRSIE